MLVKRPLAIIPVLFLVGGYNVFRPASAQEISIQEGVAAYYSNVFQGRRTASGDRYDKNALTAGHNSLPFGTRVRVTNVANAKSVVVRINDRGPSTPGRIIDLSRRAAQELGFVREGITDVKLEVLENQAE